MLPPRQPCFPCARGCTTSTTSASAARMLSWSHRASTPRPTALAPCRRMVRTMRPVAVRASRVLRAFATGVPTMRTTRPVGARWRATRSGCPQGWQGVVRPVGDSRDRPTSGLPGRPAPGHRSDDPSAARGPRAVRLRSAAQDGMGFATRSSVRSDCGVGVGDTDLFLISSACHDAASTLQRPRGVLEMGHGDRPCRVHGGEAEDHPLGITAGRP